VKVIKFSCVQPQIPTTLGFGEAREYVLNGQTMFMVINIIKITEIIARYYGSRNEIRTVVKAMKVNKLSMGVYAKINI
jgi:hypothetical protein